MDWGMIAGALIALTILALVFGLFEYLAPKVIKWLDEHEF